MQRLRFASPLLLLGACALLGCASALPRATAGNAGTAEGPGDAEGFELSGLPQEAGGEGGGSAQAAWPEILITSPGSGPGLYLGPEANSPAIGYIEEGVRVRLRGAPRGERVEVDVAGDLRTRAWLPVSRLAAIVQSRGRVEDTRTYVGPGDVVNVLGPAQAAGQMRVAIRPWLGGSTFLGPFTGTYPADRLAAREAPEGSEGPSEGECFRLPAGRTVEVFEAPGGTVVATLPAQSPPLAVTVLRQRGGWYGVRVGYGPYLTGYVNGDLARCEGEAPRPRARRADAGSNSRLPTLLQQESGDVVRVARGALVRFNGRTIARLHADGYGRVLRRQDDGLLDVFLAVNNEVALRGLVQAQSCTPVE